jgi:hypothetical protein
MEMSLEASVKGWSSFLGPNEVLVAQEVVTPVEQSVLVEWTENERRSGRLFENPQDPGAFATPFRSADRELTRFTKGGFDSERRDSQKFVWVPEVPEQLCNPLPEEFWRIRARIVELLELDDLEEDHYKGAFLSYIEPGSRVHQHRDDRLKIGNEERPILRCNILFKRPQEGGLPTFSGKEVDVPDRGMWAFFPTELTHSATEVRGSGWRGLLSFGFILRFGDLLSRRFHIASSFVAEYQLDSGNDARRTLLDHLSGPEQVAKIGRDRLELLKFVMSSNEFTLQEAADALVRNASEVWELLRDLQKSNLVESNSSSRTDRGKVLVF